jgi:glycosyltransferase involved in cell wall biosynthesis
VLIDYRSALKRRSGVGEYTHQLVKALLTAYPRDMPARPLDLTVFSSSWKDRLQLPDGELAGAATIDRRVPVRVLNFAWHRLGWPTAEAITGRAFDITHSFHPLMLPSRSAAHIITIHDLNFLTHPERTRAEIRRDYPALVRAHAHRADAIIAPSRFTAREIERQLNVPANRISVCPPGAPDWPVRPAPPADGYVLFFGTLEPRKNVGVLLDAYDRLLARRSAAIGILPPLILAGLATAESRPWLDRIARPPLSRVVRHVGYVEPAERLALYQGARLLVQPSLEEGFGLPVLEAMTLGIPVVASNRGSLPEVLGNAGPLVDADDPDQLASAIERMLDDPSFEAACAAKGPLQARHFRWDTSARVVYDAYHRATAHRQCASG